MEEKEVLITVKGTQDNGVDEPNVIELTTKATLYKREKEIIIIYQESEITGLEGTMTTLKVEPEQITLLRTGTTNSQIIFENGKRHVSHYDTEAGCFTVGIYTNSTSIEINDNSGEIFVEYIIDIDNRKISQNDFHMMIKNL